MADSAALAGVGARSSADVCRERMSGNEDSMSAVRSRLPLSPDASLVLVLAGSAMAFASSAEDEAERWLRGLRLHGDVGRALQALGVGEAPLADASEDPSPRRKGRTPLGGRAVPVVVGRARTCAVGRGAGSVGTPELLVAVIQAYGDLFADVLRASGTSTGEVLERVAAQRASA